MTEAIILAAGFGTRLRPITELIPKATFPLVEKPMIIRLMENLEKKGFKRFYVNLHYLSEKVERAIKDYGFWDKVYFQHEDPLLLTGGGLKGLLRNVNGERALVHNVDILDEFDYSHALKTHKFLNNDITWILSPERGNVIIDDKEGKIVKIGEGGLSFTGIGIYEKHIVNLMPEGKFHLVPWLMQTIKSRSLKVGYVINKDFWVDMGTPRGIFNAYRHLAGGKSLIFGRVDGQVELKGYVYIGKDVEIHGKGLIEDSILIRGSIKQDGFKIERSILYGDRKATL